MKVLFKLQYFHAKEKGKAQNEKCPPSIQILHLLFMEFYIFFLRNPR